MTVGQPPPCISRLDRRCVLETVPSSAPAPRRPVHRAARISTACSVCSPCEEEAQARPELTANGDAPQGKAPRVDREARWVEWRRVAYFAVTCFCVRRCECHFLTSTINVSCNSQLCLKKTLSVSELSLKFSGLVNITICRKRVWRKCAETGNIGRDRAISGDIGQYRAEIGQPRAAPSI